MKEYNAERIEKETLNSISNKGFLAVVQVGNNKDSNTYVGMKEKKCKELGIQFELIKADERISSYELKKIIRSLNKSEEVTGIIIQLPLPKHLNKNDIINTISPEKDVDGLHSNNLGRLLIGEETIIPATAKGIVQLLKRITELKGKHVVIIGRSNLVGKPTALLLLKEDCTITICHSKTKHLSFHTLSADIIISAVGKKNLIKKEMVSSFSIIIDVGNDCAYEEIKGFAKYITPPKGCVGLLTIANLIREVCNYVFCENCYKITRNYKEDNFACVCEKCLNEGK